jgi:Flp pilus assembly protein TadG
VIRQKESSSLSRALRSKRTASRRAGGSMIEMVFCFQVLLFLAFGMVEFGQFFYIRHAFSSAVRDGARVATLPTTTSQTAVNTAINNTLTAAGVNQYIASWLTVTSSSDGTTYSAINWSTVGHGDAICLVLSTNYSGLSMALRPFNSATGGHFGIASTKVLTCQATMCRE